MIFISTELLIYFYFNKKGKKKMTVSYEASKKSKKLDIFFEEKEE